MVADCCISNHLGLLPALAVSSFSTSDQRWLHREPTGFHEGIDSFVLASKHCPLIRSSIWRIAPSIINLRIWYAKTRIEPAGKESTAYQTDPRDLNAPYT